MAVGIVPEVQQRPRTKSWAETDGSGDRNGVWGVSGAAGEVLALIGTILLVVCCPFVALLTCGVLRFLSG